MPRTTLKPRLIPDNEATDLPDVPADQIPDGDDLPPADQGRVPPVPSRDEANVENDEALPDDAEEEALDRDLSRQATRFDETLPDQD
ncbi:hypothetical protein LPJGGPFB_02724 [Ensifer adhaerens]|uniref:hypothetical protein n=1 Tax=Ensifer adhaerens TaxID=106592 RepID=UPI001568073C|nr:hypothetical protein [Ensifer adhaerens]NRP19468.1 hypothetical protein [Ensifer adhaerens]